MAFFVISCNINDKFKNLLPEHETKTGPMRMGSVFHRISWQNHRSHQSNCLALRLDRNLHRHVIAGKLSSSMSPRFFQGKIQIMPIWNSRNCCKDYTDNALNTRLGIRATIAYFHQSNRITNFISETETLISELSPCFVLCIVNRSQMNKRYKFWPV